MTNITTETRVKKPVSQLVTVIIEKVWLNEVEAIQYTTFCKDILLKARNDGKLTFYKRGSRILYHRDDLDNFVRSDTTKYNSALEHISEAKKWNRKKTK